MAEGPRSPVARIRIAGGAGIVRQLRVVRRPRGRTRLTSAVDVTHGGQGPGSSTVSCTSGGYSRPVSNVLVTGMSGTGKSSALRLLAARGHRTVDTDSDEWSYWVTLPEGSSDWIWREDKMGDLLRDPVGGSLFVAGCKTNQGRFYGGFDHIVLLSAPVGVLLARVATRTDNPYGSSTADREMIRRHVEEVEPRLRASATIEIDATAPLEDVVHQLELLG